MSSLFLIGCAAAAGQDTPEWRQPIASHSLKYDNHSLKELPY
jgi:hypothetical protein